MAKRAPTTVRVVTHVAADGAGRSTADQVAIEEPLEIRVAGDPVAVVMRTPGHDRELALGFLFAEGIIGSAKDVGSVAHCGRPGTEELENTIDIRPAPGVALAADPSELRRRGTIASAACGVCGRRSIDDLIARCAPASAPRPLVTLALLRDGVERLRAHQPGFDRSGGLHAAAALAATGEVLASAEDVGRHNAVDKVIGMLLLQAAGAGALPPTTSRDQEPRVAVLAVSGRISFELVQKACVAGIPALCGISAPTSLAIDLAERCQIALAGFVRDGALNLYTEAARELLHNG
jgi:FdhD protein